MKKAKMEMWLVLALLIFPGSPILATSLPDTGQTTQNEPSSNACQLVLEGRNHLFNNGDPTYSGIVAANSKFNEAVKLGPGSSCFAEANLFYALTRMLSFVLENGSTQSIETGRDLLEAFGLTRNEIVFLSEGSPYNVPNQFPSNSPSGTTTQAFLTGPFMDLIDQSLANLNVVPKSFTTVLTATETGSDAIEIDDGDVQTFRTILHCMKSVLFLLKAYDLDMDIDDIKIRIDQGYFDINRDLLNKYAGFLMLLQNGGSALAASKASLIAAIDSYNTASNSIRSETDNQSDDLISIQPQDEAEEADFRSKLADIRASLTNHSLAVFGNTKVNVGEFFDDPMNLRNFLPALSYDNFTGDLIKEGPFPDSTFSGVLPNVSSCPDCSGDGFTLKDFTFYSNTNCECANNKWIRIGPNVVIQKDASVTIDAPTVIFEKQVHAEKGSYLHIK